MSQETTPAGPHVPPRGPGAAPRPARIGVMLRHAKQHEGGVKVYAQNVLPRLLAMDTANQYVLLYQSEDLRGSYAAHPNVEEVVLPVPLKLAWDQVAVPWIARRCRLDVIFNMKFSVPLLMRRPSVFILHGFEWFTLPDSFLWHDRLYTQAFIPRYCRKADAIIAVSEVVKADAVRFTGVDPAKITTVHYGYDKERFRVLDDAARLQALRERYRLPERFFLWVGQIYPPKNVGRLFQAFARIRDEVPHHLVIAGEQRWRADETLRFVDELALGDRVHFPGWVSHDDLPGLYNLADLFAFPSLYEGFGIPLLEAMACGCPILTSKTGTPPEVVRDAAYLIEPLSVEDIARGLREVLLGPDLRGTLRAKGLERADDFSWDACARATLDVLQSLTPRGRGSAAPRRGTASAGRPASSTT